MQDLIESPVRITNRVNEARYNYTSHEINLMAHIVRRVKGTQYVQILIPISELVQFMPDNNDKHDKLRAALKGVQTKPLTWYEKTQASYYGSSLVSGWRIDTRSAQVHINIDPFLLPVLNDLKKEFTIFQLQVLILLKSKFAKRIYLMCCQYLSTGLFHIQLDELKKRLALEGKYSDFKDFKKRVLAPALKELNEVSEISVELDLAKQNKAVTALTFIVLLRKETAVVDTDKRMESFMLSNGLASWQVKNIFALLPVEDIRLHLYNFQLHNKTIQNKGAYLQQIFVNAGVNLKSKIEQQLQITDYRTNAHKPHTRARQKFAGVQKDNNL